jgi:hypothetical protein
MAISTDEFFTLVHREAVGTPPGMGWGDYDIFCPHCEQLLHTSAMVGTRGFTCPCGYTDPDLVWYPPETNIGGDLCYLSPIGWKTARITHN